MIHRDTNVAAAARSAELRRTDALALRDGRSSSRSASARVAENRRFGGRGGGRRGGGGAPAALAVGFQGWATTDYYRSAVATILTGDAAGFGVALALHVLAVPTGTEVIFVSGNLATRGWVMRTAVANVRMDAVSGAAALVSSPTSAIVAGDVGKVVCFVGVHDGTTLRLYRKDVQVGAGTAITGYTASGATDRISVGVSNTATFPAASFRVLGVEYFTGAPDVAAVAAWCAATRAAASVQSMGGAGVTVTDRWQAADNVLAADPWTADVGAKTLARTGTVTPVTFSPTWE